MPALAGTTDLQAVSDYYAPSQERKLDGEKFVQLSLDAKVPFIRGEDGKLGLHDVGNVVPTSLWVKYGMSTWSPGWVATAQKMAPLMRKVDNGKLTAQEQADAQLQLDQLLAIEEEIFTINRKIPFEVKSRLSMAISADEYELLDYELRSGHLTGPREAVPPAKIFHGTGVKVPEAPWEGQTSGVDDEVVTQIEPLIEGVLRTPTCQAWRR